MRTAAAVFLATACYSCGGAPCEEGPPGFQLIVHAPADAKVASLRVELTIGKQRWRRTYDLQGELDDGETSFFVLVDPAPEDAFSAELVVDAFTTGRQAMFRGTDTFAAEKDACNQFDLELAPMDDAAPHEDPKGHGDD